MMNSESLRAAWAPRMLSVLRAITGFLLIAHGTQKLFAFPSPRATGAPELFSLLGVAGMLELAGGALLIVGLYTRCAAFVLSGFTAVAYFMAHAPRGFWPLQNGGELAALYAFLLLYLSVAGGGAWSVDRIVSRR